MQKRDSYFHFTSLVDGEKSYERYKSGLFTEPIVLFVISSSSAQEQ